MRQVACRLTAIAGIVLLGAVAGDARGESLVLAGEARVADNATLEIWGQRIRLDGIIAPEPASTAGRKGRRYLEGLIDGVPVRCVAATQYFRAAVLGRCYAGNIDIAESLIAAGHALPREQTSRHGPTTGMEGR